MFHTYSDKMLSFSQTDSTSSQRADSIMRLVISNATAYADAVSKYEAEIYVKGRTEILKQNILIHFAHHLFPVNRKNKDMIFEMVSESKYSAPNFFTHTFKGVNGNSIPSSKKQQEVLTFLNLNVYSPTAYDESLIMPVARKAFKLYSFDLVSVTDTNGLKIYKIRFLPKQWSQKLVCGDLYVIDDAWTIDRIDMNGRFSFAEFNLNMVFNRDYRRFILPEKADLFLRYNVLGNSIVSNYHTSFIYHSVEWFSGRVNKKWKSLDLSNYYRISSDTLPVIQDSAYWDQKRDISLTEEEKEVYKAVSQESTILTDTTKEEMASHEK